MKTRVSFLFRIIMIEITVFLVFFWFLLFFTMLFTCEDLSAISNKNDLYWAVYDAYRETIDLHMLTVLLCAFMFYPFHYKSSIEVTATEDCLICTRKGKFLYKLYYSEIKDYRKFVYGNYMKKVSALFVSTEKSKRQCSILGVTTRRLKNKKCQLYFECVDEFTFGMAEYVVDKIEQNMD